MTDLEKRALKKIGEDLRIRRVVKRISQEDLAFAAGVHRTQISLLESGQRGPLLLTAVRLCGALGLSPDEFLDGIAWDPGQGPAGAFVVNDATGLLQRISPRGERP